jgi:PKD repeat protein
VKNSFIIRSSILVIAAAVLLCLAAQLPASAATTERVSVASDGAQANAGSDAGGGSPWLSGDGSCVAFQSAASNLVPGDTNAATDIFVRDRMAGVTECVSLAWDGAPANGASQWPCISDDGNCVAFQSYATNLVPNDTNGLLDACLHDRATGVTEIVSVSSTGVLGNGMSGETRVSADGRFVVFTSYATNLASPDTNGKYDVFLRDRLLGTTELVSISTSGVQGNNPSGRASVSADGRFVAFYSDTSNLVEGDINGSRDVFVRDRLLGTTELASVSSDGTHGNSYSGDPSISADGRFVAFHAWASNLVPGDTNGASDIFVRDRLLGTTERVSVSSAGVQGNGWSEFAMISGDGRFVSFFSSASNLVPGDTNGGWDIFVRDRQTLTTERVSVSSSGAQAIGVSTYPHISADGRFVTYISGASNLVAGDTNGVADIFVTGPVSNTPPTAALTWSPTEPAPGDLVQFSDASSDPDGAIASWAWDFGDGTSSNAQNPTHQYAAVGTFTVTLTVTDNDGATNSISHQVAVVFSGNTPPGSDVSTDLGSGASLTFSQVTIGGDSAATTSSTPPHGPPTGFRFLGTYYDITTTASYVPPITVRIAYDPAEVPGGNEAQLKIFHERAGGGWEDVTVSVDTDNHIIIGQVNNLSWFALGYGEGYTWLGYLPPMGDADGRPFKQGSTIPIKFRISDSSGAPVTTAVATLTIQYVMAGAPSEEPEVASTAAGDAGNQFRYSTDGDLYIYNLSTKGASFLAPYTYRAVVALDDGSTHSIEFSLK